MSFLNFFKKKKKKIKPMDKLIEKKEIEIRKKRGPAKSFFIRFQRLFRECPRPEIYDDWCTVQGFANRARVSIDKLEDKKKKCTFATVQAYLNLARIERDPGQAWAYVNSADKDLPLVVDDKDFNRCLLRLRVWDEEMPEDLKKILNFQEKKLYDINYRELKELARCADKARGEEHRRLVEKLSKKYQAVGTPDAPQDPVSDERRKVEYCKQAARAQLWNLANREVSLKLSLWRSVSWRLLVGLALAIIIAEIIYAGLNPEKPWWYFPFFTSSVMGFFGGGLSALLIAHKSVVETPAYEVIKVQTASRMLLGAAGALVVYTIAGSGILAGNISQLLRENIYVLLIIGIAAGFSEQIFVRPLEKIAQNLQIFGKTKGGNKE